MNSLNIAIIGYGKMGKAIEQVARARGHKITLKISRDNIGEFTRENLLETMTDVAIEFTQPEAAVENISKLLNIGIAVVSGTTGWMHEWDKIESLVNETEGSLIYASNFSVGVNIFFEINRKLAALISKHPGYDMSITEIHHTSKKDAPSGTAITLAEDIIRQFPVLESWKNEETVEKNILPIISERKDPAYGTHKVSYQSDIDIINIEHIARSREGFALGAVLAAEYLIDKKGIFTMQDVLGMKD